VVKVLKVISEPVKVITSFKKINPGRIFGYLLLATLIQTVALGILGWRFSEGNSSFLMSLIGYFILGFIATLFIAYLLKISVNTLGGSGQYYNGLTALTLGMIAPAIGFLLFSLLALIPSVGLFLGAIVMAIAIILGITTELRAIKEMFRVDMFTAFIGLVIACAGLLLAIYLAMASLTFSNMFAPVLMM